VGSYDWADLEQIEQHICLDPGFGNAPTREVVAEHGYVDHIRLAREGPRPNRRSGRRWVVDMTYIRFREEFVYLAILMGVFKRRVRGWELGRSLDQGLPPGLPHYIRCYSLKDL
jgi:hypothetical protein